jgi:hypothetical protein
MHGTAADACRHVAGGATLTGTMPSQVAPLTVAPPAVWASLSGCLSYREDIGGRNGNFFQRGGSVGNSIKIRDG